MQIKHANRFPVLKFKMEVVIWTLIASRAIIFVTINCLSAVVIHQIVIHKQDLMDIVVGMLSIRHAKWYIVIRALFLITPTLMGGFLKHQHGAISFHPVISILLMIRHNVRNTLIVKGTSARIQLQIYVLLRTRHKYKHNHYYYSN